MSEVTQAIVLRSVGARGYLEGYTQSQLLQRQILKSAEELAELAGLVDLPDDFMQAIQSLAKIARSHFDGGWKSEGEFEGDSAELKKEIADVVIPMIVGFGVMFPDDDLLTEIGKKASRDVERGVRTVGTVDSGVRTNELVSTIVSKIKINTNTINKMSKTKAKNTIKGIVTGALPCGYPTEEVDRLIKTVWEVYSGK